ncbi:MAG: DMT family transporter [Myxococcaceae bacterium]
MEVTEVGSTAKDPAKPLKADLVLAVITAFWGGTFVVVQGALDHADPFSFLVMRFFVGATAATLVARLHLFHGPTLRAGLLLSVFLFGGYVLQTFGLVYTTPSRSAFITGLCVILVPFVSMTVLRRVPRVATWIGVALSVVGLYVLTGGFASPEGTQELKGDLLTLGCALCFACHITLIERCANQVHPIGLVAVQLWCVCLYSAVCLPFTPTHVEWTSTLLVAVGVCGIFASAVAISVQTWAQARTSAVRAALVFSLEPVFAAFYSSWTGREVLTVRSYLGGALMFGGVVAAEASSYLLARWRNTGARSA